MGGVVFGQLVGYLLDYGAGHGPVFGLAGSFHIIDFLALCWTIPTFSSFTNSSPVTPQRA
jgi:hypothetical protein